jgi:hypothetical protein
MQPLSREQVRMFPDTVKGDRMEALYVLVVTSGLRQGELLPDMGDAAAGGMDAALG